MTKIQHATEDLRKFLLVAAVVFAYGAYNVHSYGLQHGLSVTVLTWAFFVFGTPIADAGFLIAFPVRLITGFKMLYTQLVVWVVAALAVAAYVFSGPDVFSHTPLLELFYKILITPWPLWLILVLSAVGTYVSVRFDDNIYDVAASKNKKDQLAASHKKLYLMLGLFVFTFALYALLLSLTNIHIKVF